MPNLHYEPRGRRDCVGREASRKTGGECYGGPRAKKGFCPTQFTAFPLEPDTLLSSTLSWLFHPGLALFFGTSPLLSQDNLFCPGCPQSFCLREHKPEGGRNLSPPPTPLSSGTASEGRMENTRGDLISLEEWEGRGRAGGRRTEREEYSHCAV